MQEAKEIKNKINSFLDQRSYALSLNELDEQTKELQCELINYPKKPSEFIGDLFFEYEQIAGNWIPLHKNFWAMNK
jgi:hypothetical protein